MAVTVVLAKTMASTTMTILNRMAVVGEAQTEIKERKTCMSMKQPPGISATDIQRCGYWGTHVLQGVAIGVGRLMRDLLGQLGQLGHEVTHLISIQCNGELEKKLVG